MGYPVALDKSEHLSKTRTFRTNHLMNKPDRRTPCSLLLLTLMLLAACSPTTRLIGDPESPYPVSNPAVGDMVHLPTGHKISFEQLIDAIAGSRIIYVGETHDNPASHQWQLDILSGLHRKNPQKMALAMEMFNPEQQQVLDSWVAGELSEEDFLRQVDWFTNWRMNFALYRPLLDYCRENRIPIVALNAPKSLVHQVGRTPFEDLPEEVRSQLPEFDFNDPYQRAMTEGIYSGHSMGKAMSDGFLRVQTLWDETMAQNLANYLQSPQGEGRQAVVVAGGNHVRYGFGIPRRVHRRLPLSYQLVGSREIEIVEKREHQTMDVDLPHFPMAPWDYLKLTRYETLEKGVKLGAIIDETPQGIELKQIMPGSAAEKAGLLAGDILTRAAGNPLTESFDLLYPLMNLTSGEELDLEVLRAEERLEVRVEF